MKSLSFISGVLLSVVFVAPASAYIGRYEPQSTVRMTFTQTNGQTKLSTRAARQSVQRTAPLTIEWPEWIGVPSWLGM